MIDDYNIQRMHYLFYFLPVPDAKNSYKTDQIRVTLSPQKCRRKFNEQKAI
jgi:hypothetical protein